MLIRAGQTDDLPALTDLYNHYVRHTAVTFDIEPFTVATRQEWFDRYADAGPHRLLVGVDPDGVLVGYATSSPFRPKAAYGRTVETTVYLAHDRLGGGRGRALYGALLELLPAAGAHRAVAAMTLPNAASAGLHRSLGFRSIGVFTEVGHKFDRYWDTEWFERSV